MNARRSYCIANDFPDLPSANSPRIDPARHTNSTTDLEPNRFLTAMFYTAGYYDFIGQAAESSAEVIVPLVTNLVRPQSVLDVGCGDGTWLLAYRRFVVMDCFGVDGAYVTNVLKSSREQFKAHDLAQPLDLGRRFDLVQCLEVAEHLPAAAAETLVRSIAKHGDVILFSAAIPFQGGVGHVNEKWPDYWAGLFRNAGFDCYDWLRPQIWTNNRVAWWYAQNCLLFVRSGHRAEWLTQLPPPSKADASLRLVHPNRWVTAYGENRPAASPTPSALPRIDSPSMIRGDAAEPSTKQYDIAVIIPTVGRPSLARAVRSVYAQQFSGTIQLLIGIDVWQGDRPAFDALVASAPPNCSVRVFDLGYSTASRNGGNYADSDGGSLRTILSYAAHSRLVAYLDDDNWWGPDHLTTLMDAMVDHDWAYSLRWFADPDSGKALCVDQWEAVGLDGGLYGQRFGGFVDPNCLLMDKIACEPALRLWCHPLPDDRTGMSADRNVFSFLRKHGRGAATGRATVFYTLNPNDNNHAGRLGKIAEVRAARNSHGGNPIARTKADPPNQFLAGIPSRIVTAQVRFDDERRTIKVPEAEAWVINHIFEHHEYGKIPIGKLNRPPVILDVGANVGVFALYAKFAFHRDAVIHCFEPYEPVVELLRYNLADLEQIQVHPFGLGASNRTAELLCTQRLTVANSMRPDLVPNPSGRVPIAIRNASEVWDLLDLLEVDVLKIDTEGAEVEILESLGDRLKRVRVLLAEYHTQDDRRRIEELLRDHRLIEKTEYEPRRGLVKYVRADLLP